MKRSLAIRTWLACGVAAVCLAGAGIPAGAAEIDANAPLRADENPNDWLMYHQSYKSWHYSALDQINANNVKDLKVVWMHTPGANKRGVQAVPIVVDGILYYTTSSSQI
jgi:alcohol dehydrogenase (cytochrome c)